MVQVTRVEEEGRKRRGTRGKSVLTCPLHFSQLHRVSHTASLSLNKSLLQSMHTQRPDTDPLNAHPCTCTYTRTYTRTL